MSTLDDKKVMLQIINSHSPDAKSVVDENAIYRILKDLWNNCTLTADLDSRTDTEILIVKDHHQVVPEALAFIIHKIGCELTCFNEGDMKVTTFTVFDTLVKYTWDAKVALALSAFFVSYGKFCLVSQLHATHPIAKSVVLLEPLPDMSDRELLISSLLNEVMDVTVCINNLIDLPSQYFSRDKPPFSDALNYIPIAAYWAIKSIVACASESIGLINMGLGYVTTFQEARKKLKDLRQTLEVIHAELQNLLRLCQDEVEKWKQNEAYSDLEKFMKSTHKDILEVLLKVIDTQDSLPLFDGVNKKKVSLDVLKGKTVIFFISDLDISDEQIKDIVQMGGKQERDYQVVWLPIIKGLVDSSEIIKRNIERKASLMPWYSLHYSSKLQSIFIRYIEEVWHIEKKPPLLVVFNPQGQVVRTNAYHMIMIWGIKASPFDIRREENLWKETRWNLDFLIDEIDSNKNLWVKEGTVVCLYGGEDLEWIKKLTSTMKEVIKVTLEMIYVGKKHTDTIIRESMSKYWDVQKTRRFKNRLESMWYSKMVLDRSIVDDTVMKDVMMLLSADGSDQGWAVIGHGLKNIVTVDGKIIMDWLLNKNKSGVTIPIEGVDNEMKKIPAPHPAQKHCSHFTVCNTAEVIHEKVICVVCNRPMEKCITYKCCIE